MDICETFRSILKIPNKLMKMQRLAVDKLDGYSGHSLSRRMYRKLSSLYTIINEDFQFDFCWLEEMTFGQKHLFYLSFSISFIV